MPKEYIALHYIEMNPKCGQDKFASHQQREVIDIRLKNSPMASEVVTDS